MIQNYPFFANLLELRKEQFERNTAHMNLSKEEKDRRWRVFEQQQAAEMAMAMHAMNGQSNFSAFESTWTTGATGPATTPTFNGGTGAIPRTSTPSASNQVKLPLVSNGSYNFFVEWGDGKIDLITRWDQPETTHTYPTQGTYNIKILGGIYGWSFDFSGDSPKIISIEKWGCLRFVDPNVITQSTGFFAGCRNLNLRNVQDIPFLKNISTLRGMFKCAWQQGGSGIGSFSINNLNLWDISSIKNLSQMFENLQNFNQYIGDWDTSNVEDMSFMFVGYKSQGSAWEGSSYNQDLSKWNTSKVRDMRGMFYGQQNFNQNIGKWDVSNVENFRNFLSTYCTAGANAAASAALRGKFNNGGSDSIKNWNTSKVTDMTAMFRDQPAFNQEVGLWDVRKVTNMDCMFSSGWGQTKAYGVFNNGGSDSIKNWNTSSLVGASMLFYNQRQFNQPIDSWDTRNVTDMYAMFANESISPAFNQPLNNWNVSKVVRFGYMFYGNTAFNQPLNNWNPTSAADMEGMFWDANNFNQNIGSWNVSNVTKMDNMFRKTTVGAGGFNNGGSDSIKDWNVTNVRRASSMFTNRTSFTQPLTNWNITNIGLFPYNGPTPTLIEPSFPGSSYFPTIYSLAQQRAALSGFMQGKTFSDYSTANYNNLLIAWASRPSQSTISASFGTIRYTAAATTARDTVLRTQRGWSFADGGVI